MERRSPKEWSSPDTAAWHIHTYINTRVVGSTYVGEAPLLSILAVEGEKRGRLVGIRCMGFAASVLGIADVWQEDENEEEESGG